MTKELHLILNVEREFRTNRNGHFMSFMSFYWEWQSAFDTSNAVSRPLSLNHKKIEIQRIQSVGFLEFECECTINEIRIRIEYDV